MSLPLTFDPVSNGEYAPPRKTREDTEMETFANRIVDQSIRRTGMKRRAFLRSSCGMAACLAAINQVHGTEGGAYGLPAEATLDPAAADTALAGDEFIFDIQTHHVMPKSGWGLGGRHKFIKNIFLDSDTSCAVLSALPAVAEKQPLPQAEAEITREIIESLAGSPRLWVHALVTPNYGDVKTHLEGMEKISKENKIAAWKIYSLMGPDGKGFWHDDEKVGIPVIEKGLELGIKIMCTHKGIPFGGVRNRTRWDTPRDIGRTAKRFPEMKFIIYHSGYIPRLVEGPYDPDKADQGVNCLIKSVQDAGIKRGSNVYAELGTTWWNLMKKPDQAAHVLGKLLKAFGPDHVLWGTDCIWYGSPQPQIAAFRAFQISPELREKHGYPELTPEIKAKILGLSSAKVYGIKVKRDLPKIKKDDVEKLKQSYLPNRDPSHEVYGPRTRREFMDLLARRGGRPA